MRWLSQKKKETVVEEEVDPGPVIYCLVEKVVLPDGREILLEAPKVRHQVNGRVISGLVVDPVTGKTTPSTEVVSMDAVVRHVSMGWRNSDRTLHEMPEVALKSVY